MQSFQGQWGHFLALTFGWLFLLGAVLAAERSLPGGQRLRLPLGAALLAWSAVITVQGYQGLLI